MAVVSLSAQEQTVVASPGARARVVSARWVTCIVLLVATAVGVQVLPLVRIFPVKKAVPLKRPLREFDVRRLPARYERHPAPVPELSEDAIDSLGTREYLLLNLVDTTRPEQDRLRVANIMVTYYTGRPDMVPHEPEECFLAGGWEKVWEADTKARVRGVGAAGDEVPLRALVFRKAGDDSAFATVLYFFSANARFSTTRNGVRLLLMNPFERYAYYAKVEVSFPVDARRMEGGPPAVVSALTPLLEALLPRLFEDHIDRTQFAAPQPVTEPGSVKGQPVREAARP